MTYTASCNMHGMLPGSVCQRGGISYLSYYWHRICEASIWSINLMRLCVEEPKYECINEGMNEHACSIAIFGMIVWAHTQSRVDFSSRRTPAVAGPSDGWLARGCVWVWCLSPYERVCSHITKVAGTMIMLLSWWNSKYEMDGMC